MKEEQKDITCKFGDVHDPAEWDKFGYHYPIGLLENEEADKGLTVSVQKTPALGRRLRVNISERIGFTEAELKRHVSAMILVEKVINSLDWKNKLLKMKFTTTNKTPQEIYDHIMTGEETLQKGVDYEMDAKVEMYYKKNNIVGYTYSNVTTTWLNRYVTDNYSEEEIAGNFLHEWLHKLGYGHASASDHKSVPYQLGYAIRDMITEYKKGARFVDLYPEVVVTPPVVIVPATPSTPAVETPPIKIPVPTAEPKRICRRPFWPTFWLVEVCNYEK